MRLAIASAVVVFSVAPAAADNWLVDLSLRGAGSVELDAGAPRDRSAVVPSIAIRGERRLGRRIYVGGFIAAGMPAFYGQHELAVSADLEQVLRARPCEPSDDFGADACTARISVTLGGDLGIGMLFYDAPPEVPSTSDALLYWGPLARVRVQLHMLWPRPHQRAIGLVVGAGLGGSSTHYMSTATGTGIRLEPSVEIGLEFRL